MGEKKKRKEIEDDESVTRVKSIHSHTHEEFHFDPDHDLFHLKYSSTIAGFLQM